MTLRTLLLAILLAGSPFTYSASGADTRETVRQTIDLSGPWHFFPDYPAAGEKSGWQNPDLDDSGWDTVEVPHIWNLEPRYEYTGPAFYRRTFRAPEGKPGQHARLLFGAVFNRSKVWLNGTLLGSHEGGYTAFALDAAKALKPGAGNVLVVMADNSWTPETIPGSRVGSRVKDLVYPWWNYGGIKKPVYLEISAPAYIERQKITATPDLGSGAASVAVKVWIRNTSSAPLQRRLRLRIRRPGAWDPAQTVETNLRIAPLATAVAELSANLPPAAVALWDFDHPNLYESQLELFEANAAEPVDSHLARFGIRKLEIRGARLLLNGEPVSFGGANRAADHPKFGSMETREVIDQDLSMMKTANMGLARILHHPCSSTLLDWADEHGFLIIAEAGNWQFTPDQMDSPGIRANWKRQTTEMMEQGWNHPSIIAWSAGNEYQSDTPAGVRWTRDMIAFMRSVDDSRFTTFVSLGGKVFSTVKREENSFSYADFICVNIYENNGLAKSMEAVHRTWSEKPVLISEFGWRDDIAQSEAWRAQQFRDAIAILRKYPFVIGASVWSWNDYKSRFVGTNPDGYRHWGIVTPNRKPRESYFALREEFSPAVIRSISIDRKPEGFMSNSCAVLVDLAARPDFPSRTLRDHDVVMSLLMEDGSVRRQVVQRVPVLKPGEKIALAIPVSQFDVSAASKLKVELRQPTGFISTEKMLTLNVRPSE